MNAAARMRVDTADDRTGRRAVRGVQLPCIRPVLSVAAGRIAVLADENFDWRSFLVRWREEWADACDADASRGEQDEEAR